MRSALLSVLLLSSAAWAADPGQASFERACARCHTATPASATGKTKKHPKGNNGAPDLGDLARTRTAADLRAFIAHPWKVKPDTGCYPSKVSEAELDDLVAWLKTTARPPLPPREVRLKRNLQQSKAEYEQARVKRAKKHPRRTATPGQTPVMQQQLKSKNGGQR